MNIINAQVEILKEALKNKTVIYGVLGDKVFIGNPNMLYIIPKNKCGIDLTNIDCNNITIIQDETIKRLTDDFGYENVTLTNDIKLCDNKKLRVFLKDNESICVDTDLLKNFDLKESTFKCRNSKCPILIYEYEVMVGLVLPFHIKWVPFLFDKPFLMNYNETMFIKNGIYFEGSWENDWFEET